MAFCSDKEDSVSVALTVTQMLLDEYQIDPSSVGYLAVASEPLVDKSKNIKSALMMLFPEENRDIVGVDVKHACYSGTQALFDGLAWLSWTYPIQHRYAIVVCSDIAVYSDGPARKELKKMAEMDEDSTQTQLATAWVNLALGREKLKDAYYIFQEQIDRHGATPLLLVGQSTALILQKFEEAETLLQDAQARDSNNADAMINMIVVSAQLGQPSEVVNRLIDQMKDSHFAHPWTRSFVEKEEVLNKIAVESSA